MFQRSALQYVVSQDPTTLNTSANFSISDDVFIEAQRIGKTPALCAADSPFVISYDNCQNCIIANGGNTTSVMSAAVSPQISEYLRFCQASPADNSSVNSQLSAVSTAQAVLSSKVAEGLVSILTQTSTLISVSISTVGALPSVTQRKPSASQSMVTTNNVQLTQSQSLQLPRRQRQLLFPRDGPGFLGL